MIHLSKGTMLEYTTKMIIINLISKAKVDIKREIIQTPDPI